jgi:hypothetical protein
VSLRSSLKPEQLMILYPNTVRYTLHGQVKYRTQAEEHNVATVNQVTIQMTCTLTFKHSIMWNKYGKVTWPLVRTISTSEYQVQESCTGHNIICIPDINLLRAYSVRHQVRSWDARVRVRAINEPWEIFTDLIWKKKRGRGIIMLLTNAAVVTSVTLKKPKTDRNKYDLRQCKAAKVTASSTVAQWSRNVQLFVRPNGLAPRSEERPLAEPHTSYAQCQNLFNNHINITHPPTYRYPHWPLKLAYLLRTFGATHINARPVESVHKTSDSDSSIFKTPTSTPL